MLPRDRLGSPLGSPRGCVEDASRRLLQPTSRNEHPDRSPDFRARGLRRDDQPPRNVWTEPKPNPDPAAAGAEPPCGNPTPDEHALDGARPTEVPPSRASAPRHVSGRRRRGAAHRFGRHLRHGVFDRERDRRSKPLTLPVAPRRTPRAFARSHLRGTRTASVAPASTRTTFPAQSAFHRQVLQEPFRELGARHRSHDFAVALRLPTLLRLSNALAWRN